LVVRKINNDPQSTAKDERRTTNEDQRPAMVLLQPKLHLKVSQRQILTPGLVQMVSVLALNKLELRDMITAEMVENPVLEELEDSVPLMMNSAADRRTATVLPRKKTP